MPATPFPVYDPLRAPVASPIGDALDQPAQAALDRLTRLAASVLNAPVVLASLVQAEQQLFLSCANHQQPWASLRSAPLSYSFCRYVVESGAPVAIDDSRFHPLAESSPDVAELKVAAYAGVPLRTQGGQVLGTFCAIDHRPRAWTRREIDILVDLAASVVTEMELRADIRARVRVEEALERERVFLNAVLDSLDDGIAACDRHGVLTLFNRSTRELHGLPERPIPASEWAEHYDLYAADGMTRLETAEIPLFRALQGEEIREVEMVIAPRAGTPRRLLVSGQAFHDAGGKLLGAVVAMDDITQHKETERALRQSEQRYRSLVEAASDIIYNTNAAGFFTYVNPVASQIVGLPPEVLVGTHYTELIREDAREEARAFYMQQLVDGVPTTYYEFPISTPDGREIWVGQNLQLVFRGSTVVGTQAVARDVTARREMERIKDEFISLVSHELRTPLTSMRGALGLISSGKFGLLDPRGQEMLEVATRNAERLSRLVSSILDVQRMEAGRLHLERRVVDLATVMEDAVASMRAMAETAHVQLYVSPIFEQLSADPDRLLQALTNLLSNAIKFSPANSAVWVTAERQGGEIWIRVTDQGRGIPADKLGLIFERFRQVDLSDARQKDGSGLGLSIARSMVEQHGGRLWVESELGRGSRFTISLPVVE